MTFTNKENQLIQRGNQSPKVIEKVDHAFTLTRNSKELEIRNLGDGERGARICTHGH